MRPWSDWVEWVESIFQSTHPSWGATLADLLKPLEGTDFNPRTHRGVRRRLYKCLFILPDFNPRTHRGVRQSPKELWAFSSIISIHAPIVGCDRETVLKNTYSLNISIHAPIVGCDIIQVGNQNDQPSISIHAPIVGCDIGRKREY